MTQPAYFKSIHHDGSRRYVQPQAIKPGDTVTLRLRAAPNAPIQRVLLHSEDDGEGFYLPMTSDDRPDKAARWWKVELLIKMPVTHYRFLLFTEHGAWWYNGSGLHEHTPTDSEDFRLLADFITPEWVQRAVFYQIFPDRFYDGDAQNNVRDGEYEYRGLKARSRRWQESPTSKGLEALVEFYGGDLPGITQKLDTLQELGVNALYLNPIFTAYSNHRYDVCDYFNVDPHLGGNQALVELRQGLSQRGMRYILDIVPNHCGVLHPWFIAAQADPNAPTADFFTFNKHPDDYATWLGVKTLPKLNYRSEKLRQVMYAGQDAVFRHWLQPPYSADGWRIDVANMLARQGRDQLGVEVGRGIRQAVKETNPEAYLMGENFFDASTQLQGDIWDGVMNYAGFSMPVWYWLQRFAVFHKGEFILSSKPWSAEALVASWQAFRASIPWQVARLQFNSLGSHDTMRIRFTCGGDLALNRMAAVLLFTYVGTPCVYYGEEVGLGDSNSQEKRQPMPWGPGSWDWEMRAFYQKLIALRKESNALIEGGFQVLLAEDCRLAFLRDSEEELLISVAFRGPGELEAFALPVSHGAVPEGVEFVELFSGRRARVENGHLPLPAMSPGGMVWRASLKE
jgi:alpha-glucosidase